MAILAAKLALHGGGRALCGDGNLYAALLLAAGVGLLVAGYRISRRIV